ncbi:MAG: hypothetical protein R2747_05440 [Pyrinomonadaceae bacterium]
MIKPFLRFGYFFIFCFVLAVPEFFGQNADSMQKGQEFERKAVASYREKKFDDFLNNMLLADKNRPNHPRLIYNLGAAYALNGETGKALEQLKRLARMGLFFAPEKDEDFQSLSKTKGFDSLQREFLKNKAVVNQSQKAFSISEKGLITESVAYNPADRRFFIGSVHQRKILAVDEKGGVTDFSRPTDGLWSVLGMRVDQPRQILWVSTTAFPQMNGFEKDLEGRSGIFKYDLKTGKLIKKYLIEDRTRKHAIGDLVVNKRGDVFATDSIAPIIYRIEPADDELKVFLQTEDFSSLQGLALTPDEKTLFVADYSKGIFRLGLENKSLTQIQPARNLTLLGIDGLYLYRGDLIAIQNGVNPQRVVRFQLNGAKTRIKGFKTLEANHPDFLEPTLGTIVGNEFFYIANSQWPLVNEKAELKTEDLREPVILKLNL